MRRGRFVFVRFLVVTALLAATTAGGSVVRAEAASLDCGKTLVIGVRGSGETVSDYGGYGQTVLTAIFGFRASYGPNITPFPLGAGYTAASVDVLTQPNGLSQYLASIASGEWTLLTMLAGAAQTCPTQPVALFGYSQGAMVVHELLDHAQTAWPSLLARIVGVGLIADPLRLGGQSYEIGTAKAAREGVALVTGVAPRADLPTAVRGRAQSVCNDEDPVCAFDYASLFHTDVHKAYKTNGWASSTGSAVGNLAAGIVGTVATWGANGLGELGVGTTGGPDCGGACSTKPVGVLGLAGASAVSAGDGFACALVPGAIVKCWGRNGFGQLGDGKTIGPDCGGYCNATPVTVVGVTGVNAISVGFNHACALLSGGTVKCWGFNAEGQLGTSVGPDCTGSCSATPVTVTGLSGVTSISAGDDYSCAIVTGGTVKCWGFNTFGELGNGVSGGPGCGGSCSATPVSVSGISGATAMTAGGFFACAVLAAGTVKCWGNATTSTDLKPVVVAGLSGVTAVGAGFEHACALLSGGTVKCWGQNFSGELGNGTTGASDNPVAVLNLTGVTAIGVGDHHSCAVLSDKTARCWGVNAVGELGDGTTTSRLSPVVVSGLKGVIAISCGGDPSDVEATDGLTVALT